MIDTYVAIGWRLIRFLSLGFVMLSLFSASRLGAERFEAAGRSRVRWILGIAIALMVHVVAGLIASVYYLAVVRPELGTVSDDVTGHEGPPQRP